MCVCEREREKGVCVCVIERERERKRDRWVSSIVPTVVKKLEDIALVKEQISLFRKTYL